MAVDTAATVEAANEEFILEPVVAAFEVVSKALSAETDLDGLLNLIADRMCQVVGVNRCALYLRDEERGLFMGKVAHPPRRRDADAWMERSVAGIEADRFTQEILATKEPVLIANARQDPRCVRQAMIQWNIRTMLGVPMVMRDEVIGLLFLDNADTPHDFPPQTQRMAAVLANLGAVAISQARKTAELRKTLSTVAHKNRLLNQVSAMEDRLAQQVLDGASLEEIAASIASVTDNPCAIYDSSFELLASCVPSDVEAPSPSLADATVRANPEISSQLAKLVAGKPAIIGAAPGSGMNHRELAVKVQGAGVSWAFIVLAESARRLTTFDALVARRAAAMVGLELSAQRRILSADAHARESLVRDLVHGDDDQRSLSRRAEFHHIDLSQPRVICVLRRRAVSTRANPTVADVSLAWTQAGFDGEPLCAVDEQGVALLLDLPSGDCEGTPITEARREAEKLVRQLDPDGGVIGGVSPICRTGTDYPRALQEAHQVVQCMSTLLADESVTVLSTEEFGAGRLLLTTSSQEAVERFAMDSIGVLLEDDRGRSELLKTLTAFFAVSRNIRSTGIYLGVHENTVRYRLSKISELTGLDVAGDGDDQLTAQIALLVFRLRGWLGPWNNSEFAHKDGELIAALEEKDPTSAEKSAPDVDALTV